MLDFAAFADWARPEIGPTRADPMLQALDLAHRAGLRSLVETGCMRSYPTCDGASTRVLAEYCHRAGTQLVSLELNPDHIQVARSALVHPESVEFRAGDSVAALSRLQTPVEFLYLDSYDFQPSDPMPSAMHQLAEVGAALGHLAERAIILLDDWHGGSAGKGSLAVPFLLSRGWRQIIDGYQAGLVNFQ